MLSAKRVNHKLTIYQFFESQSKENDGKSALFRNVVRHRSSVCDSSVHTKMVYYKLTIHIKVVESPSNKNDGKSVLISKCFRLHCILRVWYQRRFPILRPFEERLLGKKFSDKSPWLKPILKQTTNGGEKLQVRRIADLSWQLH